MNPDDARRIAQARCAEETIRTFDGMLDLAYYLECVERESRDLEEGYKG